MLQAALLGKDIQYTLSPKIYAHPLVQKHCPMSYEVLDLPQAPCGDQWAKLMKTYQGINITTPYKGSTYDFFSSRLEHDQKGLTCTNCLYQHNGTFRQTLTDAVVFRDLLKKIPLPKSVLIYGSGDMSKMCQVILQKCDLLTVFGRSQLKDFDQHQKRKYDLVINASKWGQSEPFPSFILEKLEASNILDFNYIDSTLKTFSLSQHIPYVGGLEFLIHQAIMNLSLWHKLPLEKLISLLYGPLKEAL
jgi:shikimate dehydrogenase